MARICDICLTFRCDSRRQLDEHKAQEHKIGINCTKCEEVFINLTSFKKHALKKHKGEFLCEICGEKFNDEFRFEKHHEKCHEFNEAKKLSLMEDEMQILDGMTSDLMCEELEEVFDCPMDELIQNVVQDEQLNDEYFEIVQVLMDEQLNEQLEMFITQHYLIEE